MKSCAQYIAETKAALGNARMSDRELGLHLGAVQQNIARARVTGASDGLALKIGKVLEKHGLIEHAGEVILAAHAERDSDPQVRKALKAYLVKIMATVPAKAVSVLCALTVALVAWLQPAPDARLATGGEGR